MLSQDQINFYQEHGYLHVPGVYDDEFLARLDEDLEWIMDTWAMHNKGWDGPWRKEYMDDETEKVADLVALNDMHLYSAAWTDAVRHETLLDAMCGLLGPNVEFHHTTLHCKPPGTGHPFPVHQDYAFYKHNDDRYVDVLIHLDDTCHENGEIRFIAGSHKMGSLEHVTESEDGPCTPHLPTDAYSLDDTVAVPAKRGDVVCFNINTIHGSYLNTTDKMRRMIRVGYRHPNNLCFEGHRASVLGELLRGRRERTDAMPQPY